MIARLNVLQFMNRRFKLKRNVRCGTVAAPYTQLLFVAKDSCLLHLTPVLLMFNDSVCLFANSIFDKKLRFRIPCKKSTPFDEAPD